MGNETMIIQPTPSQQLIHKLLEEKFKSKQGFIKYDNDAFGNGFSFQDNDITYDYIGGKLVEVGKFFVFNNKLCFGLLKFKNDVLTIEMTYGDGRGLVYFTMCTEDEEQKDIMLELWKLWR